MLPVVIDITNTINAFRWTEEDAKSFSSYLLDSIAVQYMQKWEEIVDHNLKGTRQAYKSGMHVEKIDEFNLVFTLEGKGESKLGLMIEAGASPWDMKNYFRQSTKTKKKADGGWFLTIPFKIATSEAIADSSVFAGKMPKPIENIIQKQDTPLTSSQIPQELRMKDVRAEIPSFAPAYEHKSYNYEGLVHTTKPGHEGYIMFRRVSDESDPNSWMHRGFQPHNFMEKALEQIHIDEILAQAKKEFITAE
jgi:hypothetical protein